MSAVAIIPARGGSKGIPEKNIMDFCGFPLLSWTIAVAQRCPNVSAVLVSTDCPRIAEVSRMFGAEVIVRPVELSGDNASSESALIHACEELERRQRLPDTILFLQATSPLRETFELVEALEHFENGEFDSLFSAADPGDYLIWQGGEGNIKSVNYDWKNRKIRQEVDEDELLWIETGSYYITRTKLLMESRNRFGGRIGYWIVPIWKSFEIDSLEQAKFCELLMQHYGLAKIPPKPVVSAG